MIKENEKQMADFITSRKKDIPGRPTHRFSSPSIFSAGFWPHHTEEHAVPLLGKDHPKPGKTGQRGMIT